MWLTHKEEEYEISVTVNKQLQQILLAHPSFV